MCHTSAVWRQPYLVNCYGSSESYKRDGMNEEIWQIHDMDHFTHALKHHNFGLWGCDFASVATIQKIQPTNMHENNCMYASMCYGYLLEARKHKTAKSFMQKPKMRLKQNLAQERDRASTAHSWEWQCTHSEARVMQALTQTMSHHIMATHCTKTKRNSLVSWCLYIIYVLGCGMKTILQKGTQWRTNSSQRSERMHRYW